MFTTTYSDDCDLSIPLNALAGWHVELRWSASASPLVTGTVQIDHVDNDGDLIVREVDPETGIAESNATIAVPVDDLRGIHVV